MLTLLQRLICIKVQKHNQLRRPSHRGEDELDFSNQTLHMLTNLESIEKIFMFELLPEQKIPVNSLKNQKYAF